MADLLTKLGYQYEPLRKNRWLMRFPSDLGIAEWMLSSASRPSVKQNSVEIQFMNHSRYVAGRYNWEPINVTFRDPVAPSASQALMEWIRLSTESVTGRQGYAMGYKRDVELEMLDPTGVCVQKWILKGAWISTCNFNGLDYSQDGVADISATIVVDYCILCF